MGTHEGTMVISISKRTRIILLTFMLLILVGVLSRQLGYWEKIRIAYFSSTASVEVIDRTSKKGLSGVQVSVGQKSVLTDEQGLAEIKGLKKGYYDLQATLKGYREYSSGVTLTRGINDLGIVYLSKEMANGQGEVIDWVTGNPIANASVEINSKIYKTDSKGLFTVENLDFGKYTVKATAIGYNNWSKELEISKDKDIEKIELVPAGKVAYTSNRDGKKSIYLANFDRSGETQLIERRGDGEDYNPVMSPDGKYIAFISTRDLEVGEYGSFKRYAYLINVDGTGLRKLGEITSDIKWSLDSRAIGYTFYKYDTATQKSTNKLIVYEIGANNPTEIYSGEKGTSLIGFTTAKRILYTKMPDDSYESRIYSAGYNGDSIKEISNKQITYYSRRFDNKWLLGYSENAKLKYLEYSEKEDVAKETNIELVENKSMELLSQDGTYKLYSESRDGKTDLYIQDKQEKETKITNSGTVGGFSWSTNPKYVLFTSFKNGSELFIVGIDGKGQAKKVADVTGTPGSYESYGY